MAGTNRIQYIDTVKGLGILLVVLGHNIGMMSDSINPIILSFHMPLFFFVSGLLFNRAPDNYWNVYPVSKHISKKIYSLFIPLCTMWFITLLWVLAVQIAKYHTFGPVGNILGADGTWFLIVMIIMDLVLFFCLKLARNRKLCILALHLVSLVGFMVCSFDKVLYVQQALAATAFGTLGYLMKPLFARYHDKFKFRGAGLVLLLFVSFLAYQNDPVGMYMNQYGNKLMFYFTAILGVLAVSDISMALENVKVLHFFGRNSLIIFITHFVVYHFAKDMIVLVMPEAVPSIIVALVSFVVTIAVEIPIVYLANRFCPWLFGVKK